MYVKRIDYERYILLKPQEQLKDSLLKLGYVWDDYAGYCKELYCNYNEINPKLAFGTLYTDGKELRIYAAGNYTNEFIRVEKMNEVIMSELNKLLSSNMIKKAETLDELRYTIIKMESHLIRWSNGYYFVDFYLKSQTYCSEDKSVPMSVIREECRRLGFKQVRREND